MRAAATEADLPAILAVDRAAFGADRGRILTRLPGFADRIAVSSDAGPRHRGYAAAWRNTPTSTVIGPLVAPDAEAASALIADAGRRTRTAPSASTWTRTAPNCPPGRTPTASSRSRRTVVMAHGELTPRGTPDRLFTPISVALA